SQAIRAVYGQWVPWLVLMDRSWTSAHLRRIFPPDKLDLREVAWETYIVFCAPYDNVLEVLEREYAAAIERLGERVHNRPHLADPDERLGEHLMLFYGRGKLGNDPRTGLVGRFFELARESIRGRAIHFIGESLSENEGEVSPAIIQRFTAL